MTPPNSADYAHPETEIDPEWLREYEELYSKARLSIVMERQMLARGLRKRRSLLENPMPRPSTVARAAYLDAVLLLRQESKVASLRDTLESRISQADGDSVYIDGHSAAELIEAIDRLKILENYWIAGLPLALIATE